MEDDRWRDFSKWDEKMMQEFIRENAAAFRVFVSRYAKLSPQARRVMEMTLEERPLQEIAKELGVTVNTVKTVKYRALNRLSELLTPEDFATVVMMCCAPYLW